MELEFVDDPTGNQMMDLVQEYTKKLKPVKVQQLFQKVIEGVTCGDHASQNEDEDLAKDDEKDNEEDKKEVDEEKKQEEETMEEKVNENEESDKEKVKKKKKTPSFDSSDSESSSRAKLRRVAIIDDVDSLVAATGESPATLSFL